MGHNKHNIYFSQNNLITFEYKTLEKKKNFHTKKTIQICCYPHTHKHIQGVSKAIYISLILKKKRRFIYILYTDKEAIK